MTRRLPALIALSLLGGALLLGCGKKGPPQPPLVGSKPRITDLSLRQEGSTVRARFSMPFRAGSDSIDYSTRAIELWRRPVSDEPDGTAPVPAPVPIVTAPGAPGQEGASPGLPVGEFTKSATLAQSITGGDLFDLLASPTPELVDLVPPDLHGTELEYALVLKTDVKSSGTVSDLATITPQAPPAPPEGLAARVTEKGIALTWTPAKDAEGRPLPVFVYRAEPDRPYSPDPLNEQPAPSGSLDDVSTEPGATYRYVARSSVPGTGAPLQSDPTPEIAATWTDLFPPAVPQGLRSFVEGGAVTLLWTPNDERDLLGYNAWRRSGGGEWTQLNESPLPSATFTDATPAAGRHEYAVSAVDRSTPPNESDRTKPVPAEIEAE